MIRAPALAEGFAGFTTAHKLLEIKLLQGPLGVADQDGRIANVMMLGP